MRNTNKETIDNQRFDLDNGYLADIEKSGITACQGLALTNLHRESTVAANMLHISKEGRTRMRVENKQKAQQ